MQQIVKCPICYAAFWTATDRKTHIAWHREQTKTMQDVLSGLSHLETLLSAKKKEAKAQIQEDLDETRSES